jgi:hypothetical protein
MCGFLISMTEQHVMEKAIRDVLTKKEDGQTIIEQEVQSIIDGAVRKLTFRFGIAFVVLAFGFGGWVTTIMFDVKQNTEHRQAGGRYTAEHHETYSKEVDRRFTEVQNSILQLRTDYKSDITEMKGDIRYIRDRITQ